MTERLDEYAKKFKALLAEKNLKYTYERRAILDEISRLSAHFDADSLYDRFKKRGLKIARDTVYRTLPLLLESGIIQKSVGGGKREFFERTSAQGHHDHMVCIRCQTFIEFHSPELEALQDQLARDYSFKLLFHDHRLFGICKNCAAV